MCSKLNCLGNEALLSRKNLIQKVAPQLYIFNFRVCSNSLGNSHDQTELIASGSLQAGSASSFSKLLQNVFIIFEPSH